MTLLILLFSFLILAVFLYFRKGPLGLISCFGILSLILLIGGLESEPLSLVLFSLFLSVILIVIIPFVRRNLISRWMLKIMSQFKLKISNTEREALNAGTVWWDRDLFSGHPDWKKFLSYPPPNYSEEEIAFLDGPVNELCKMLDDWKIVQKRDLPNEVWEYIKKNKFWGMIIPKEYGGLGFSALAHSQIITKICSRSLTAAVTVMVPNSIGPAELLLRYGTQEQKKYFLPRLVTGEEIPCFALTEIGAGSDAAALISKGIIANGKYQGKECLGMILNWEKRYITLGPIATVIGLAFHLYDPEELLGGDKDIGITCALIPSDTNGIEIGNRHDPIGVPFQNGPNCGKDVFVPLDFIIGGKKMAGRGWKMLMECLAAGRSVSLPSISVAGAERATREVAAYATVREQFNVPIGKFEGVEERLAEMGAFTYLMNSGRLMTLVAVDLKEQPTILSGIVKTYLTEMMRTVTIHGMDIMAGAAICRGPRNDMSRLYQSLPIGITVEGANILTRSLIIFGQGALRCHPYLYKEMVAIEKHDVAAFDKAIWGHINHFSSNLVRSFWLGLTNAYFLRPPGPSKRIRGYFKQLTRMSSAFALLADVAMFTFGSQLKRKEKISGRFADALAWMYLSSATIKRYIDEGEHTGDEPYMRWGVHIALFKVQMALREILQNYPYRYISILLKIFIFPTTARLSPPNDKLGADIAKAIFEDPDSLLRLTGDIYSPPDDELGPARIELAWKKIIAARTSELRVKEAIKAGILPNIVGDKLYKKGVELGVIKDHESRILKEAFVARREAIQVDDFSPEVFNSLRG